MHRLDMERAGFRIGGKGHTWADLVPVCGRCERLYLAGDDDGLNDLRDGNWPDGDAAAHEYLSRSLDAFRHADLGAIPLAEWWPPGVAELVADGFTPLEDLTGDLEIAAQWPESDRRAVPETRAGWDALWHDGRCWLVRSPWTSIAVTDVIALLWQWIADHERPRAGGVPADEDLEHQQLVRQFLHAGEEWALEFKRTKGDPV